ncbi:MAG: cupin domain-containing protein [Puniceicoccaceae bacterium]
MKPRELRFEPNGGIPNHPHLPVLFYRGALEDAAAETWEDRFRDNGWGGAWRWSVFDYHHFHPDAHEALGVASGSADLRLGGPEGKTVHVEAGDLVVLPAGTGHKKETASADFQVVGAYPPGQEKYSVVRASPGREEEHLAGIADVPPPESDPAFGANGPLSQAWRG